MTDPFTELRDGTRVPPRPPRHSPRAQTLAMAVAAEDAELRLRRGRVPSPAGRPSLVQIPVLHARRRPVVLRRPDPDPLIVVVGHGRPLVRGLVLKVVTAAVKDRTERSLRTICAARDENIKTHEW